MRFIVYETQTGIIKRIGNCEPNDVVLQAGPAETVISTDTSSDIHPDRHKIENGVVVDYVPPVDIDALWKSIRQTRNRLLTQSDWTQVSDNPITPQIKQAWQDYRQALRDLPGITTDPFQPVWPTPPSN